MSEDLYSTLFVKVADVIPILSDCHCMLSFDILASFSKRSNRGQKIMVQAFPGNYIWAEDSAAKFQDALYHPACKSQIKTFINNTFGQDNRSIDLAVNEFNDIIKTAASRSVKFKQKLAK